MPTALEQFSKLPTAAKAGATGALVVVMLVVYYFVFYSSMASEKESLLAQRASLEQEKSSYEARVQDYLAFRNEVNRLQEEQKDLLKRLPPEAEIPSFLEQIHQQAEMVGVEVQEFLRNPDVEQGFFAKIPVTMRVRGRYHRIAKFFRNVGELRRIVNIEGLKLQRVAGGASAAKEALLEASFQAATFRFVDKDRPAGAPK